MSRPSLAHLEDLTEQHASAASLAAALEVSPATVYRWLAEAGLPPPGGRRGAPHAGRGHAISIRLSGDELDQARARAEAEGVSLAELARRGLLGGNS